ncbi:hypothetical protein Pelo_703 [Pelomyxa schiedti]|nr:hypothetical protein Pelo_703 [Pelomyxa schiedti]
MTSAATTDERRQFVDEPEEEERDLANEYAEWSGGVDVSKYITAGWTTSIFANPRRSLRRSLNRNSRGLEAEEVGPPLSPGTGSPRSARGSDSPKSSPQASPQSPKSSPSVAQPPPQSMLSSPLSVQDQVDNAVSPGEIVAVAVAKPSPGGSAATLARPSMPSLEWFATAHNQKMIVINMTNFWEKLLADLNTFRENPPSKDSHHQTKKIIRKFTSLMEFKHKGDVEYSVACSAASVADGLLLMGSSGGFFSSIAHYSERVGELFPGQFVGHSSCDLCHTKFGPITRRHSCRMCGASVCSDCRQVGLTLFYRDCFFFGTTVCNACNVKEFKEVTDVPSTSLSSH